MTVRMLLRQVKLENLLSFRNTTVELRGLNVLIGANASGKSNLIEAISLLQAAPVDLSAAILRLGGVHFVCSLAIPSPAAAIVCRGIGGEPLQYRLEFLEDAHSFIISREHIGSVKEEPAYFERVAGNVEFDGEQLAKISPTRSVFEAYKSPADPTPITRSVRASQP
jgi:hypothetical protein